MKFSAQSILAASALISGAAAQTFTACDPTKKTCPPDKGLGEDYTHDFSKGASDMFEATGSSKKITYGSNGMTMMVKDEKDAPTLTSKFYILGGRIDVVMKAAPGQGVISSLVFQSDCLDEIDYEWIGSKGAEVQSNYFGKGDTSSYDRGGIHQCPAAVDGFKTYSIDWTKEKVTWYIDNKVIRELVPSQVKIKNQYPQTPMQIKIGAWDAGAPDQKEGTLEWAGGHTDYKTEHPMIVKSIKITDYNKGAKEYTYGDKTGTWDSIKISNTESGNAKNGDKGAINDSNKNATTTSTTLTSKPSSNSTSTSSGNSTKPTGESSGSSGSSGSSTTTGGKTSPTAENANSGVGAIKALSSAALTGLVAVVVFAL